MKPTISRFLAVLCAVLALYFLMPLPFGVCHIGMLYPAALLLLAAAVLIFPDRFRRLFRGRSRPWAVTCSVLLGVGLSVITATLIIMGVAAANHPDEDTQPRTVIVLGCQVIDTEPSIMLNARIDAACEYLTTHPDSVVIASGGMADDEIITEAECIRQALIRRGIAPERIYSEERSCSTAENLLYSAALIRDRGLSPHVAIASDNFHQLRAAIFARQNDLDPASLGCRSVWYLGPGYWAREVVGVAAALIRGY